MIDSATIAVEVAYARPDKQVVRAVQVARGATVADAVRASGILETCADIPWPNVSLGIFSRKVAMDYPLQAGDRVEIYRPLLMDPKDRRRARAG